MSWKFLNDRVIAKMPVISSGNTIVDLLLGEDSNCDCRLLSPEEINDCHELGFDFFSDVGLGEFEGQPCSITKLNERGRFHAQELHREKYWPKCRKAFSRFCQTVSGLVS